MRRGACACMSSGIYSGAVGPLAKALAVRRGTCARTFSAIYHGAVGGPLATA